MIALFQMIVAGFVRLFGWFGGISLFANSFSALSNLRFLTRYLMLGSLVFLLVSYVALLGVFAYYMVDSLVTLYNLISSFLTTIQNPAGAASSPVIQTMLFFINATGIAAGVQVGFPFVASALVFRLMKILYKTVLNLHEKVLKIYTDLVKIVTGA